jgi:S-adenosyl methyltransferase
MPDAEPPPGVDVTRPSPARLYDYYLGGTNNFAVDREAAEQIRASMPELADAAWANRGFHGRAAAWLAAKGLRQFLDLGSGLPTQNNTHTAVHKVAPDARVVYVDIDPMVAAHAQALLAHDGTTAVVAADLRDLDALLRDPRVAELIDASQPTAVLMTAVMHFVPDSDDPWGVVARYMNAMAPGSYLALPHVTHDKVPSQQATAGAEVYARASTDIYPRTRAEIEKFFAGLELVAPYRGAAAGLAYVGAWGAEDPDQADSDGSRYFYCGVARRP